MNKIEVYTDGYVAGYNQARTDMGELTQGAWDIILKSIRQSVKEKEADEVLQKKPERKYQIREVVTNSKIRRRKEMHGLLHFTVDELYKTYLEKGGELILERSLDSTVIVWTRLSKAPTCGFLEVEEMENVKLK